MAVPSVSQPVRPSSLASVAKCSDPSGTDDGGEALRRKPSAVSFDAGVREESERKPVPLNKVPEALAHLEDIAPRPTRLKGLSTIVKGSGSLSTASRAQRASFVDFGAAKCAIIRMHCIFLLRSDPAPLSSENVAVMEAAGERSASRGKRRGVQCACATYLAIFSLSYVPSVVHQLEPRGALIGALTSMVLVTSMLTSCLQAAFEFIRRVWQMLPWGAILLLGSTHVASELVQVRRVCCATDVYGTDDSVTCLPLDFGLRGLLERLLTRTTQSALRLFEE
ncbi:hypothetical protein V5799_020537 [Amblyomma americanum]|uniref:Uncharacterized protein n=1 Tax=Amblyomma americanum TaxID=6943 RepID=A0AAQ4ETT7_AMBAM